MPRFDIGVYIYIHTHDYNSAGTCLCFYCQNKFIKKKHRNVSTQSKYMVYTCYNGDILQLKQPQLISGNATWPAFHLRISIVSEWPSDTTQVDRTKIKAEVTTSYFLFVVIADCRDTTLTTHINIVLFVGTTLTTW